MDEFSQSIGAVDFIGFPLALFGHHGNSVGQFSIWAITLFVCTFALGQVIEVFKLKWDFSTLFVRWEA